MAGAECCVPAPHSEHSPVGKEDCWDGINVYVNQSANPTAAAVVLVSDIFGWDAPLLRKLADKVAGAGFTAVVPDLLYGDYYDPKSHQIQTWIQGHQAHLKPLNDCKKIIEILHSKGVSSVGVSGFCWGAKVVILAAKDSNVNAVVMCHPSFVNADDLKNAKAPIAILAAETDHISPPELIMEFKQLFEQSNKEHFVKIYSGTAHGWTCRYDVNDESAVKKAEEAHHDFIAWFRKYLI